MERTASTTASTSLTRGAFWASMAFYALVALEFFYMVSPFAAYLYGVYGPGLDVLKLSGPTSGLIRFFMPHIARETRSLLVDGHAAMGGVFLGLGLAAFGVGASQVYWSKLRRRGAVVSRVYRWIRHPQYLGLMVASFGMLLIWPRYLVLFGFVTVCFAYYLLARLEEGICARKFADYPAYASRTGMFLPAVLERAFRRLPRPRARAGRIAAGFALYGVTLLAASAGASMVQAYAIRSLYLHATPTAAYLSLGRLPADSVAALARVAGEDPRVRAALAPHVAADARFIDYVMPAGLLVSEVPMYIPPGRSTGHESPGSKDQGHYKIVFTRASFGPAGPGAGQAILRQAIGTSPIVEVWIDRRAGRVERVLPPPARAFYGGMPVPVY